MITLCYDNLCFAILKLTIVTKNVQNSALCTDYVIFYFFEVTWIIQAA